MFVSRTYGGRTGDQFITNNSGFLNHLENGDVVLADRGFPVIKVDGVITVIPPRAVAKQKQFSAEQTEETYKIASVRVHVERVIQRLKIFKLLSETVPLHLLQSIDRIVHLCAALVNLQPPIIAQGHEEEENINGILFGEWSEEDLME